MATRTDPTDLVRIHEMFNGLRETMLNLAARWIDEKEYESIKTYGDLIQRSLPDGFTLVRMTRRPFGFEFHIGTGALYAVTVTAREYRWMRLS